MFKIGLQSSMIFSPQINMKFVESSNNYHKENEGFGLKAVGSIFIFKFWKLWFPNPN